MCTILWHSHPPTFNGIALVCVGAAVSSVMAGDSVYRFRSGAAITTRVEGGDVTIGSPFCSCKQRSFWCSLCFWMWLWHDGGLQLGKMRKPSFLFHTLLFSLGLACNAIFLYNNFTCEHFESTDAFGPLVAGFYGTFFWCISHNNPWHWITAPQMMQTKLQLLHSYDNSAAHTCMKGLFILNTSLQIFILNAKTQCYMV